MIPGKWYQHTKAAYKTFCDKVWCKYISLAQRFQVGFVSSAAFIGHILPWSLTITSDWFLQSQAMFSFPFSQTQVASLNQNPSDFSFPMDVCIYHIYIWIHVFVHEFEFNPSHTPTRTVDVTKIFQKKFSTSISYINMIFAIY